MLLMHYSESTICINVQEQENQRSICKNAGNIINTTLSENFDNIIYKWLHNLVI